MDFVTAVGFIAAALVVATLSMRRMIPLRVIGISSNIAFVTYGILFHSVPTVILHSILLPLNIYRLREMLNLIKQVEAASKGDMSLDWLKPFMSKQAIEAGQILFRKGDEANSLYFIVTGRLHLREIDVDILPGSVVGDLTRLLRAAESGDHPGIVSSGRCIFSPRRNDDRRPTSGPAQVTLHSAGHLPN